MARPRRRAVVVVAAAVSLLAACTPPDGGAAPQAPAPAAESTAVEPATESPSPESPSPEVLPPPDAGPPSLEGLVVVVDPGHQLGNRHFPRQVNALVDAGNGSTKPCNTTGTATDGGVPEATVNWEVSALVVADLRDRGAEVLLTRDSNSDDAWGPCVDVRGSTGNDRADLLLSIHADGAPPAAHGFHVLIPAVGSPEHEGSLRLGEEVHDALESAGVAPATYVAGALRASDEYATLNHSAKPAVIVELGNMRHDGDAAALTDADARATYARALVDAVVAYADEPAAGAP